MYWCVTVGSVARILHHPKLMVIPWKSDLYRFQIWCLFQIESHSISIMLLLHGFCSLAKMGLKFQTTWDKEQFFEAEAAIADKRRELTEIDLREMREKFRKEKSHRQMLEQQIHNYQLLVKECEVNTMILLGSVISTSC